MNKNTFSINIRALANARNAHATYHTHAVQTNSLEEKQKGCQSRPVNKIHFKNKINKDKRIQVEKKK